MKLLLDTHAWLWFVLGDPQLSLAARDAILDPANMKFVSPASYWEVSIKIRLGKYVLAAPYAQFMRQAVAGNGFRFLHISPRHTELVATLPFVQVGTSQHRDPFDRLLVAQAPAEQMSLVSQDGKLAAYGVPVIW